MSMKIKFENKSIKGFTLVELLVVISLIAILTAAALALINPVRQREIAEDGVKRSNLQKYALGVEAFANANAHYPQDVSPADGIPDGVEDFIANIPNNEPVGTVYNYYYTVSGEDESFAITVNSSENHGTCFKYNSDVGSIQSCTVCDTVAGCL